MHEGTTATLLRVGLKRQLARVCLSVQEFGVVSYTLLLSLIEYKTLVLREDMEAAQQLLPTIPKVRFPFLTRIKCPTCGLGGLVLLQPCMAHLPLFCLINGLVDGSSIFAQSKSNSMHGKHGYACS